MPTKVYFVSAEVGPFSGVTPTKDFSYETAAAWHSHKHDVRILTPRYNFISERKYVIREVIRLREVPVQLKDKELVGSAKSAFLPGTKVQVYFVDQPREFGSKNKAIFKVAEGRYNSHNPERFFFFSKFSLENLTFLYWQPDYILCNDWPTALVPVLLKTVYREDDFFSGMKTVLNIVNPDEFGKFEKKEFQLSGLPLEVTEGFENNLLALAAAYADTVTVIDHPELKTWEQLQRNELFREQVEAKGDQFKVFKLSNTESEGWRRVAQELEDFLAMEE